MIAAEVGQVLPELRVRFTRQTLVQYAGASGDFNKIHFWDRVALDMGLPGVIAHGMLTMGTALRVVANWVEDPARVVSYFARFTKPVVVPDTEEGVELVFTGTVTGVVDGVATVAVEATCEGQKVLGMAKVEVRL